MMMIMMMMVMMMMLSALADSTEQTVPGPQAVVRHPLLRRGGAPETHPQGTHPVLLLLGPVLSVSLLLMLQLSSQRGVRL